MPIKTVDLLLEESGRTIKDVAEAAGLLPERMLAIAEGHWTPSPEERRRVAAAFGVAVEDVSWGHTMNPRNVRYRRFGLREDF